ncbi:MAG: hypothetical protein K6U89_12525 [Chloroflexi bacterium]|nr:hypothetical protein [Chloroflexota bacterium]
MITPEQIHQLEQFSPDSAWVLSLYLGLDPERQIERMDLTLFKDLTRTVRESLATEEQLRAFNAEVEHVTRWLEMTPPQGRGLALFSCLPAGLWQAHFLPVRVRDRLVYEPTPYLTPLLDILDEYERYAVVLVDKERARLFTVFLGAIEESEAFEDEVPGRHDQGGWAQARLQRHHAYHVLQHLKRVVEKLRLLQAQRAFDRWILAGPEEATSELVHLLPPALARRLVATLSLPLFASPAEVLAETLRVEQEVERQQEDALVTELLELAGGGGRATVGRAATLTALAWGGVRTLVVAEGLRLAGVECTQCGALAAEPRAQCPVCQGPVQPVEDVVERAVERALATEATVELVHGEAARKLQERGEGIGALLRYPVAAAIGQQTPG